MLNIFFYSYKNFKFQVLVPINFFLSNNITKKAFGKCSLHTNIEIRDKINYRTNIEVRQIFLTFHKEVYDCQVY